VLRALAERPQGQRYRELRGGAPDFYDEAGSFDLPAIRIDAFRQDALQVGRSSTLYVRPSGTDVASQLVGPVGLVLAGALIGAAASDDVGLAIILALATFVLLAWRGVTNLRR
jgi:hypothetical protein